MYVLQVASFDKLDVAKKEVSTLKSMKYDAFMDKTSVKGKTFFRVRIGPVAMKDKALQMMNELQIRRLPVMDEGRVVGIVSREDLVRAIELCSELEN